MPSEEDARTFYETHVEVLNDIESGIRAALPDLPRLSGVPEDCETDGSVGDPSAMIAECVSARSEWRDAEDRFRSEVIPALMSSPHLVGFSVLLTSEIPNPYFPGDDRPSLLIDSGNETANMRGSTLPQDGITIEERQVGWGLGQVTCQTHDGTEYQSYGDSGEYKQLDVEWEFVEGITHVSLAVYMLVEDVPSSDWREHCLMPSSHRGTEH